MGATVTSFDLIVEPWIPCVIKGRTVELGLRETFARAHEILELADQSPLVTVALHRLLLAVAHRVFGPENVDEWDELWKQGRWDASEIDRYFTDWHDRFDLFSPKYPFFQAMDLDVPEDKLDAYKLVLELGESNTRMFSDVGEGDAPSLSPAEAARALIAIQSFHRSGTVGRKRGVGPVSCVEGPLARAAVCLVTGNSLFETLLLNMVDYSPGNGLPFRVRGTDRPVWERGEPPDDIERRPDGYLDWLTWVSWISRLIPDECPDGIVVRRARIVRGAELPKGEPGNAFETMVGYRIDEKRGLLPVSLRRERAVWRDSAALFQRSVVSEPPKTLVQLSDRAEYGALERRATYPLGVHGVAFDQGASLAVALFWRHDRLPLPLAYLDDPMLYGHLVQALGFAEASAQGLRSAVRILAAHQLSIDLNGKLKRDARERLGKRVEGIGAGRQYWASLEPLFSRFLADQAAGSETARADWAERVLGAARNALVDAALSLPSDGESLRTQVEARGRLEYHLAQALRNHPVSQVDRKEAV